MAAFTPSSLNTQEPVSAHLPQFMQPAMGLTPMWMISLSMPCFSSCFATSLRAVKVQPLGRGLPLIINTDMGFPPWICGEWGDAAVAAGFVSIPLTESRSNVVKENLC